MVTFEATSVRAIEEMCDTRLFMFFDIK